MIEKASKFKEQHSFKYRDIEIYWLFHSGFKVKTKEGIIYFDPYHLERKQEKADIIFISHTHYDHFDEPSIKALAAPTTTFFCSHDAKPLLAKMGYLNSVHSLLPFDEKSFGHLKIRAVPAYNKDKRFHPKENRWVGYLVEVDGVKLYFAGDTDHLKELENIDCDIGFFPISGTYVMDPVEAAELANCIKPKVVAIPMHWGLLKDDQNQLLGTVEDAKKFCQLYKGASVLLKSLG